MEMRSDSDEETTISIVAHGTVIIVLVGNASLHTRDSRILCTRCTVIANCLQTDGNDLRAPELLR
jgi:hypothetical protein